MYIDVDGTFQMVHWYEDIYSQTLQTETSEEDQNQHWNILCK
jgi:hypothetical protein